MDKFDKASFVQDYWQKKPCLIKQFAPGFEDPLDENDLAGLAQEEDVDSRIVSNLNGVWDVHQGPFDDFSEHCKGDWSILVQGVNNYIDEVEALSSLVDFIPHWRFDDVMVSYSTQNAGVGAHTDQYDVFIVQGKGSRRWQVGLPSTGDEKNIITHPLLRLIEDFTPVIDEVLQPGDAIYIPPKHPHKGMTLHPCLNYSLGFRAPTNLEALNGLLDESDDLQTTQTRYSDPDITRLRGQATSPMEVTKAEIDQLKANIVELLNSSQAEHALMQYLSRQSLPAMDDIISYTVEALEAALLNGSCFEKMPGVKPIYKEQSSPHFVFYIDGNSFKVDTAIAELAKSLLASDSISEIPKALLAQSDEKRDWLTLLSQLIDAGYWIAVD